MANCSNCAAPLPPNTSICTYCKTKNNVDLKGIGDYSVHQPESKRFCPRCETKMHTLKVKTKERLYIEQCDSCYGLFFDPGELEYLVSQSVDLVFDINHQKLDEISSNRIQDYGVKYIKCPVCSKHMNRINFGARSGVIVDKCKEHGIWLDGGELKQIMEWTKAGGKLFDDKKQEEIKKIEEFRQKQIAREQAIDAAKAEQGQGYSFGTGTGGQGGFGGGFGGGSHHYGDDDIVSLIIRFVRKFF